MKIENLLMLGTANHIDLIGVAKSAIETHKLARQRQRTDAERALGLTVRETAEGHQTRVTRKPRWTHAELGQAMAGVPRMPFLAACFSIWGDGSVRSELHRGLMVYALKLAGRENWPDMLARRDGDERFYTAELCALVLDADMHRPYFTAAPSLYAAYLDVYEPVWDTKARHWFRDAQLEYERWVSVALGMGSRRLRDDDAA